MWSNKSNQYGQLIRFHSWISVRDLYKSYFGKESHPLYHCPAFGLKL